MQHSFNALPLCILGHVPELKLKRCENLELTPCIGSQVFFSWNAEKGSHPLWKTCGSHVSGRNMVVWLVLFTQSGSRLCACRRFSLVTIVPQLERLAHLPRYRLPRFQNLAFERPIVKQLAVVGGWLTARSITSTRRDGNLQSCMAHGCVAAANPTSSLDLAPSVSVFCQINITVSASI